MRWLIAGLKEVFKRLSNPLWKYMLWDQVSACAPKQLHVLLMGVTLMEHCLME